MSKVISVSTNDELEIAEFIARLGGLDNPSDDQLWKITECIDFDEMNELLGVEQEGSVT